MFQCENQTGPAETAVDEEQKTDSMEIDDSSHVSPVDNQQQQLAYVPTPTHTPATTHQENNDDGEDVPMDDDLAEEEKTTDLQSKVNNHEKKNVKRVNWEKTEDTKKSNSHLRENKNKSKTGSQEAPRQQQQWRPKTNNSTTQPANCEVPKEKKKEQEEKKRHQQTQ
jgi:hypothetical protein